MRTILFIVCLTIGIWFGYVNTAKVCYKMDVSWSNLLLMSLAWAGVITFLMCLW